VNDPDDSVVLKAPTTVPDAAPPAKEVFEILTPVIVTGLMPTIVKA
jgi:hypothetical protein